MSQSTPAVIGIDVSKDHLDAFAKNLNQSRRFGNDSKGIAELIRWARSCSPERVLLESTGHYHLPLLRALLARELPAVLVNARQVRDFARATGQLAKTDRIDARVLAHFGEVVPTTVGSLPSKESLEFRELCGRRSQLVHLLAMEKNHLHAASSHSARLQRAIRRTLNHLEREIAKLEGQMDRLVQSCETFRARDAILRSIPGVGPQVSRTLLVYLPELGQRTRQEIASLVGLAPMSCDSGQRRGSRHIRGGRKPVRRALYQAAVVAVRCCPRMRELYARLKGRGKASKVALVAVARKLLVLANALIRTGVPYEPAQQHATPGCGKNS